MVAGVCWFHLPRDLQVTVSLQTKPVLRVIGKGQKRKRSEAFLSSSKQTLSSIATGNEETYWDFFFFFLIDSSLLCTATGAVMQLGKRFKDDQKQNQQKKKGGGLVSKETSRAEGLLTLSILIAVQRRVAYQDAR